MLLLPDYPESICLSATKAFDGNDIGLIGQPIIPGDVNCDGETNLLDVAPFVNLIASGSYLNKADMNEDGSVDLLDVAPFIDLLSGN